MNPRQFRPWLASLNPIAATPSLPSQPTLRALTFGLALTGATGHYAYAASQTWDAGAATQEWNTAANWTNDAFPNDAASDAFVNTSTGLFPIITADSAFTPRDVIVGDGASNSGLLDHQAGSLSSFNTSAASGGYFIVGRSGGTGTYNLADTTGSGGTLTGFAQGSGSLTYGKLWIGGTFNTAGTGTVNINTSGTVNLNSTQNYSNHGGVSLIVGTGGGNGTLNIDNGTVNAAGIVDVASAFSGAQATQGTLKIGSGGTLNTGGDFRTAFAGSAGALGTVTLSGGTLNVGSTAKRAMILGNFDNGSSTVTVSSGNLNLNTNTDIKFKTNGGSGTHIINLDGGAITSYSDDHTTANGAGVVDLRVANSTATTTFNLNGGTLAIRQIITTDNNTGGTATFNFNGGTLKATGATANFVDLGGAAQTAVVKAGGAVIDSNTFDVTVVQALLDGTGGGGLTKQGTGTLTLSGVNTYTGATTISGGTVALGAAGSIDNTSVVSLGTAGIFDVSAKSGYTVNNLTGSGSVIGALTVSTELAIGNSPGTVNFSSDLTIGSSSTYLYELVGGSNAGDLGNVAGHLTITNSILDLVQLGTYTLGDKFTLLAFNGTLTGTFNGLADGGTFTDGGGEWQINYNDDTAGLNGGSGTGFVTITAVPEPGAALLGCLGIMVLLRRRR